MRALVLLAILLFALSVLDSVSSAPAVIAPAIPTEGGTWTSPTITVLITPQLAQPWFKASYTFDVHHAISRWPESIISYTDAYGSNYLRKLNFITCISGVNDSLCGSPDIQVQFIQSFGSQSAGLGLTSIRYSNSGIFQAPTTTTLAAYDPTNTTQLTDNDMINIASHEFGHALGLNHATVSRTDDGTFELMFLSYGQPVGNSANSLEAPSTLDLYALAYVYYWLASSSMLSGSGHPITVLSLPSGVAYSSVYPYPEQIEALQNSTNRKNLEITVLAIVAAFLLAIVLVLGILLSRKKPVQPPSIFMEPVTTEPSARSSIFFKGFRGLRSLDLSTKRTRDRGDLFGSDAGYTSIMGSRGVRNLLQHRLPLKVQGPSPLLFHAERNGGKYDGIYGSTHSGQPWG